MLRRFLLHLAEYFASAAAAAGAPTVRHAGMVVADLGRPSGFFNSAVLLQPPAPDRWDGVLDSLDEAFADGTGDTYLWSAWPTPDLRPRGWQLTGHPPLLVRPPGGRAAAAPRRAWRSGRSATPAGPRGLGPGRRRGLPPGRAVAVPAGQPAGRADPPGPALALLGRLRGRAAGLDRHPLRVPRPRPAGPRRHPAARPVDAASGPRWSASVCAPSPTCSAAASSATTAAPASSGWATCRSCASRSGTAPGCRDRGPLHSPPPTDHKEITMTTTVPRPDHRRGPRPPTPSPSASSPRPRAASRPSASTSGTASAGTARCATTARPPRPSSPSAPAPTSATPASGWSSRRSSGSSRADRRQADRRRYTLPAGARRGADRRRTASPTWRRCPG